MLINLTAIHCRLMRACSRKEKGRKRAGDKRGKKDKDGHSLYRKSTSISLGTARCHTQPIGRITMAGRTKSDSEIETWKSDRYSERATTCIDREYFPLTIFYRRNSGPVDRPGFARRASCHCRGSN
ncbi:hypothetical protein PUN28_017254 [Cardiocondyla obscurior]|uniref:Uncharacterized protein n=1 Tax=Cardiocondyla obscurior TaxID=286306 RepID=A0AAW2EM92_9HYME